MNRKSGGQAGIVDRRTVVVANRGRVDSDNDDMDESWLSDDDDEQVLGLSIVWFKSQAANIGHLVP